MSEAYNPAEDEKKLREFLDPERLYYDIDIPNRWVRCLAAKILEENCTVTTCPLFDFRPVRTPEKASKTDKVDESNTNAYVEWVEGLEWA